MNVVLPMGERAWLVETPHPLALANAVRAAAKSGELTGVIDIVPAAATVLVRFTRVADDDQERLARLTPQATDAAETDPHISIPVTYDGEDLGDVAELTGLSIDEVIARHSRASYRVDFCGFAPGFGYLSGVESSLHVPRLSSPRPRVPAGSVALAAGYTAVYPRSSPGGWRLIGRTNVDMFDPHRDPAALLAPGTRVTFDPVDRLRVSDEGPVVENTGGASRNEPSWEVLAPGALTLVQDLGRPGYGAIAVGAAGAFDRAALRLANRLVGNTEDTAALECLGGGLDLLCLRACTIAVTGAGEPFIDGRPIAMSSPITAVPGQRLALRPSSRGLRTAIAVRGGIAAGHVLGSASHDTLSGLGPPIVRAGDLISVGEPSGEIVVDVAAPRAERDELVLRVLPGPRRSWFNGNPLSEAVFTISGASDRIGVRLDGPALLRTPEAEGRELPPEGMVRGAIQVPPDGQPVILGPDHPVTGGYPVIAVVVEADLDLLAQARPGTRVRFTAPG